MAEHPNILAVRKIMQAMFAGDTAAVRQLLTRDCVVYRPGSHPFAGEHQGLDAVLDIARRLREETDGTMRAEPHHLFLDGRGHVIAVYRLTAERRGRRHDMVTAAHLTIVGDRIAGIEVYTQDLDQTNQFWA